MRKEFKYSVPENNFSLALLLSRGKHLSIMDSILDIDEKFQEADAIKSNEYNEYLPTSGSNLNIPGTITIPIESQDEFFHPRRSLLLIEGELLKADDTRYT